MRVPRVSASSFLASLLCWGFDASSLPLSAAVPLFFPLPYSTSLSTLLYSTPLNTTRLDSIATLLSARLDSTPFYFSALHYSTLHYSVPFAGEGEGGVVNARALASAFFFSFLGTGVLAMRAHSADRVRWTAGCRGVHQEEPQCHYPTISWDDEESIK